jgi:hypothetical protein
LEDSIRVFVFNRLGYDFCLGRQGNQKDQQHIHDFFHGILILAKAVRLVLLKTVIRNLNIHVPKSMAVLMVMLEGVSPWAAASVCS